MKGRMLAEIKRTTTAVAEVTMALATRQRTHSLCFSPGTDLRLVHHSRAPWSLATPPLRPPSSSPIYLHPEPFSAEKQALKDV